MTKGYLVLAQNNKENYIEMATFLAMSVKITQSDINSISLITDMPEEVPYYHRGVFDHIIKLPYDDAKDSEWKIENRWKLYHLTPYDETIILDADMLFLNDMSNNWKYLEKNHELFITNCVQTYRNEIIKDDFYRKAFTKNLLPNTYSAYSYFKKTELSLEFWKWVEIICKNWKDFYKEFLVESRPNHLSIDVVFALAVKIMGIENKVFPSFDFPTFTHMKGCVQNWNQQIDPWHNYIDSYFTKDMSIKLGNFQQQGILHYTEKGFLDKRRKNILYRLYKEKLDG